MSNANFEGTFELPTRGLLYTSIPAEVTLRGMTTKEEKILFASAGGNVFQKILQNCITDPEGVDAGELISADELFLILQLRKITYGEIYSVTVTCPVCGAKDTYKIDLNDFEVNYLPEDFKEPIEVTLPRSGDKLELHILRNSDIKYIDKQSKKLAKQFNIPVREIEYTMRMARFISTINGNAVDTEEARSYVDTMMSMDSAYFWSVLNKIKIGFDTSVTVSCQACQEEFDFNMPITSEFFRPKFD